MKYLVDWPEVFPKTLKFEGYPFDSPCEGVINIMEDAGGELSFNYKETYGTTTTVFGKHIVEPLLEFENIPIELALAHEHKVIRLLAKEICE